MNNWVDLHALWRIVAIGLACGAGLPAVFALGLKALSLGEQDPAGAASSGGTATATRPVGLAVAAVCFLVVLAAIGWGIYLIVDGT